ncbi:MAG: FKBP-type peptidyl-prolyl cis-trans isomerase [Bacteroidales bacterium]|nr:FKBP-type peptidyl-prolyl cis-trans isomerase [Bacteroidales bacterium]
MKKQIIKISAAALLLSAMVSCNKSETPSTKAVLNNELDTVSYILGNNIGSQFSQGLPEVNKEAFYAGFCKGLAEDSSFEFTMEEAGIIYQRFMTKRTNEMMKKNLEEAEAFLAENKTKEGVVTTESGLQYKIITPGDGKQFPVDGDEVECLYRGTLINGKVFDGTELRGNEPVKFNIKYVIPGWTEMLKLMSLGEKVQVWIHPKLGYGENGNSGIEPNSLLIFEMELLQIIKPEPAAEEPQPNTKKK